MSENITPVESVELPEDGSTGDPFTDAELADFIERGGEAPSYHTILEVWREVLRPAAEEATRKVTPQWANRIVQSFPGIGYGDMVVFRDIYYAKVAQFVDILNAEIASDPDCLTHLSPAEDAEHNAHHYKNLLLTWQMALLQWELDWDTEAVDAATELAAISEVHRMFFGQTGFVSYLDNIKFEFTEADQATLGEALQELREGQ